MVKCLAAFLDFCYIVRRNAVTDDILNDAEDALARFHHYRNIFIQTGVRIDISLPRQHSLIHYIPGIRSFGSANGLCSSITESKHIKAVKKPWCRSSRYKALPQMLRTNTRLDKLRAVRSIFESRGMMAGSTTDYTARMLQGDRPVPPVATQPANVDDYGAWEGPRALSSVFLAAKKGV